MRKSHRPLFPLNEQCLICAQSMSRRLDGSSPTTRSKSPSTSSVPFQPPRAKAVDGTRTLLVMNCLSSAIATMSLELYPADRLAQWLWGGRAMCPSRADGHARRFGRRDRVADYGARLAATAVGPVTRPRSAVTVEQSALR